MLKLIYDIIENYMTLWRQIIYAALFYTSSNISRYD